MIGDLRGFTGFSEGIGPGRCNDTAARLPCHERNLFVGKTTNFLTIDGGCAIQNEFLEHRHDENGSSATLIDKRNKRRKTGLVGCFLPEVCDMNPLPGCRNARKRNVRYISPDKMRLSTRWDEWIGVTCRSFEK